MIVENIEFMENCSLCIVKREKVSMIEVLRRRRVRKRKRKRRGICFPPS